MTFLLGYEVTRDADTGTVRAVIDLRPRPTRLSAAPAGSVDFARTIEHRYKPKTPSPTIAFAITPGADA